MINYEVQINLILLVVGLSLTCIIHLRIVKIQFKDQGWRQSDKFQGWGYYGYGIVNNAGVLFYCYASDSMSQVFSSELRLDGGLLAVVQQLCYSMLIPHSSFKRQFCQQTMNQD